MVEGMGGPTSPNYARFRQLCFTAFEILRKNANLILNLVALMQDASVGDIKVEPDRAVGKVCACHKYDDDDDADLCAHTHTHTRRCWRSSDWTSLNQTRGRTLTKCCSRVVRSRSSLIACMIWASSFVVESRSVAFFAGVCTSSYFCQPLSTDTRHVTCSSSARHAHLHLTTTCPTTRCRCRCAWIHFFFFSHPVVHTHHEALQAQARGRGCRRERG